MKDLACSITDAAINSRVVAARAASVAFIGGCGSGDREPVCPSSSSLAVSVWTCNSRSLYTKKSQGNTATVTMCHAAR